VSPRCRRRAGAGPPIRVMQMPSETMKNTEQNVEPAESRTKIENRTEMETSENTTEELLLFYGGCRQPLQYASYSRRTP